MTARTAVDEHVAAFNAHDTQRLLGGLTPDAVWITGSDTVTGHAALADMFDDWLWSMDPRLEPVTVIADDRCAAAQFRETLTVEGERREFHIAVFFELAGGLIRRAKVYREGSADL